MLRKLQSCSAVRWRRSPWRVPAMAGHGHGKRPQAADALGARRLHAGRRAVGADVPPAAG